MNGFSKLNGFEGDTVQKTYGIDNNKIELESAFSEETAVWMLESECMHWNELIAEF